MHELRHDRSRSAAARQRDRRPLVPADPWRRALSRQRGWAPATSRSAISRQIARAADELGYFGVLLPTGRSCEDSWVIASAMVPLTERLRFLVAVRPGPDGALRRPPAWPRPSTGISDGRLLINVVTGGDPVELQGRRRVPGPRRALRGHRRVPDDLARPARRARPSTFKGKHLRIENGTLLYPPVQKPYPPLYFGGSSRRRHARSRPSMSTST